MSLAQLASITCPQCKESVSWTSYSSVNVSLDPELKAKVLSHELFNFTCPHCSLEARITDPLLYHDMTQQLMIQLAPEDADFNPEALDAPHRALGGAVWNMVQGITTRIVRSPNQLVEKILLFGAGLDDRVVECLKARLKLKMAEQFPGDILFDRRQSTGKLLFVHLHEGAQQAFEISPDFWQSHAEVFDWLEPRNAERWPEVDFDYAMRLYDTAAARNEE